MESFEFVLAGIGILSILIALIAGVLYVLGIVDMVKSHDFKIGYLSREQKDHLELVEIYNNRVTDFRVRLERLEEKKK